MNKIVNGVANDFEYDMHNISYSKAYTEQLLAEKDKEIERLKEELRQEKEDFKEVNDYCFELKENYNLARNILFDYLYNDEKITKERYKQFKELKEGK